MTDDQDEPARARALIEEARVLIAAVEPDDALQRLDAAAAILKSPNLADRQDLDPLRAEIAIERGQAFLALRKYQEALDALAEANRLLEQPHLANNTELDLERAEVSLSTGIALNHRWRVEEALIAFDQADAFLARPHLAVRLDLDSVRARVAIFRGATLRFSRRHEEALASYDIAEEFLSRAHIADRLDLDEDRARLAMYRGIAFRYLRRLEDAIESYDHGEQILSRPHLVALPALDEMRARVAIFKGVAFRHGRHLEDALASYQRAKELLDQPHLSKRPELDEDRARLASYMGIVYRHLRRLEKALSSYAWAEELLARPHLSERPELDSERAKIAMFSGITLRILGLPEDALKAYKRAQELFDRPHVVARPEFNVDRARLGIYRGIAFRVLGQYEASLGAYLQAETILSSELMKARPELDIERARVSVNMGVVLRSLGRTEEALVFHKCALEIHRRPHIARRPEFDVEHARIYRYMGVSLNALDRPGEALDAFALASGLLGRSHLAERRELDTERARLARNIGLFYLKTRQFDDALSEFARAESLLASSLLTARSELDGDRALIAWNRADCFIGLERAAEALESIRSAYAHWSEQNELPLPRQVTFAHVLSAMSGLLALMPPDSQSWAVSSSDRLVGMLDLAEPVGKLWDEMRGHFAAFHVNWLRYCLSGSEADRAMVPRVLAALQGRRLIAEALEAAEADRDGAPEAVRAVVTIKAEMRALLRALGVAEGVYFDDGIAQLRPGGDGGEGGDGGTRSGGFGVAVDAPARDEARIAALRSEYRMADDRLAAAKAEAAQDPAYGILTAPLSGITTERLRAVLAPGEVLVLTFPLPAEDKGLGSPASDDFVPWVWALRADRDAPVVLRLPGRSNLPRGGARGSGGAGPAAAPGLIGRLGGLLRGSRSPAASAPTEGDERATEENRVLPSWALSLPAVVAHWDRFGETLSGRGGVRQGGWGGGDAGGAPGRSDAPGDAPDEDDTDGAAPATPARLTQAEMAAFWGDLDRALAQLFWGPLAASGVLDGAEDILVATVGALHNLPLEPGRGQQPELARARLLHQSSLAAFARGRGLFGARPELRDAGPMVHLLAPPRTDPGTARIPLALVERRIAARLWAQAGATVATDEAYPWDPAQAALFAHAACHGDVLAPPGGTPGAHLLLRRPVSERALLAGPGAREWLMGACVGGRVHDDRLDGNPTGLVAGARGTGSVTAVAALPPLPDREGFLFGLLVSLLRVRPLTPGQMGPFDLAEAALLAQRLLGGLRSTAALAEALPVRTLAAAGGTAGLDALLEALDTGLRRALAEDLAIILVHSLDPAMTSPTGGPANRTLRLRGITGALNAPAAWWLPAQARDPIAQMAIAGLDRVLAESRPVASRAAAAEPADEDYSPETLTERILSLVEPHCPDRFALLPDPLLDPVGTGAIRYGIITFHDPQPQA